MAPKSKQASKRPDPIPQTTAGHAAVAAHLDAMAAKALHIRDSYHMPRSEDYRRLTVIADGFSQGAWMLQHWNDYYSGRFEPDEYNLPEKEGDSK